MYCWAVLCAARICLCTKVMTPTSEIENDPAWVGKTATIAQSAPGPLASLQYRRASTCADSACFRSVNLWKGSHIITSSASNCKQKLMSRLIQLECTCQPYGMGHAWCLATISFHWHQLIELQVLWWCLKRREPKRLPAGLRQQLHASLTRARACCIFSHGWCRLLQAQLAQPAAV